MQSVKKYFIVSSIPLLLIFNSVYAGSVDIIAVDIHQTSTTNWSAAVTLKHNDTGWKHYADNWQIVDGDGKILGDRILFHPHVNEQPFTRSLDNIHIPVKSGIIYIKAHDKIHGWTARPLKVDLNKMQGSHLRVENH